ncbi:MAG: hypothetical protein WBR17_39385 [Paraburkholderia sp.]|uniref:hypothetical protein n=1 Tax=Paraburkholderia sp. TaxID=1926495 RepID=UPI003C38E9C5
MKALRKGGLSMLSLVSIVLLLGGCGHNTQASGDPNDSNSKPGLLARIFQVTKPVSVPEGTQLDVVLNQSISTAANRSGDPFQASLASPVVIDDKTVIPKDALVTGHIVDARPSGHLKGVARLELTLDSVEVNGATYGIATGDFGRTGKNHNKRNGILIGGGAGLGAIIGGVAGGGVGALIGSSVGAGAGTAGAAFTGKRDIRVPSETTLSFRLARPVTIPVKS